MKRNVMIGVYTDNDNDEDIEFDFYTSIRATDKIKFVKFVIDTLIDNDYHPEIRDLIFDFAIVHVMTDVDVSDIIKSDNAVSIIEDFLDKTNIVEIVKANAPDLIDELNKYIDDKIEFRTGIHKNPISEGLGHLLKTIDKKISDIDTDSMMQMAQVFKGMSGEMTIDKMLEAYSKSDLFKKNHEETIANREKHNAEIDTIGDDIKKANSKKKSVVK